MTINETIDKVKAVGKTNVRIVPTDQNVLSGNQDIQVSENGTWTTVYTAANRRIAESILSQAVNRVILG